MSKTLTSQALSYLKELTVLHYTARTLRSEYAGVLIVPTVSKCRTVIRSSSYQAPLRWNQLPVWVRKADTLPYLKVITQPFLESGVGEVGIRSRFLPPKKAECNQDLLNMYSDLK